jgi:hypothetical protein
MTSWLTMLPYTAPPASQASEQSKSHQQLDIGLCEHTEAASQATATANHFCTHNYTTKATVILFAANREEKAVIYSTRPRNTIFFHFKKSKTTCFANKTLLLSFICSFLNCSGRADKF